MSEYKKIEDKFNSKSEVSDYFGQLLGIKPQKYHFVFRLGKVEKCTCPKGKNHT